MTGSASRIGSGQSPSPPSRGLRAVCGRPDQGAPVREAQRRNIALAPVNEIPDVLVSPQLAARDFFVPVHVPELGRTIRFPGRPYRLSDDPPFRPRWLAGPGPAAAALLPESAPPRPADVPTLSRPTPG
jgi:crotonobetainyl-CoA:carnitine CoA-transferase CaiB-like acyl-CoA transferase